MRRLSVSLLLVALLAPMTTVSAVAREPEEGVKVGNASYLRRLIPAQTLETSAQQQFVVLKQQAGTKGALLPPNAPQNLRLRRIAADILPHVEKWNPRAKDWRWEVVTIKSGNVNAFCMPGGKIAFFTGILDKLQLTDDEVAIVMGHEIAHALREHARARAVKSAITNVGARVMGALIFGQGGEAIGAAGGNLLTLRFSRSDETDADLVGLELAARAGYDPAAGVRLWEKMSRIAGGAPAQWLSTHPASATRIQTIKSHLGEVAGLYERAKERKATAPNAPATTPSATELPASPLPGPKE